LCKTHWVEKQSRLKTFGELYERMVTSLDAMDNPHVCPEVNTSQWDWDVDTKTTADGMESSLQSLGVIVAFTV